MINPEQFDFYNEKIKEIHEQFFEKVASGWDEVKATELDHFI